MQDEAYLAELNEQLRELTGTGEAYEHLEHQRGRTRTNCECGGDCAYCGRQLHTRHEHDHFPLASRYGGDAVVPVCHECHTLKDRIDFTRWPAVALGNAFRGSSPEARILCAQLVELAVYWHMRAEGESPTESFRGTNRGAALAADTEEE